MPVRQHWRICCARLRTGAANGRQALDAAAWEAAPYRPVPTIVEAATMLYSRHSVAEIAAARADVGNLTRTTEAIRRAIRLGRRR